MNYFAGAKALPGLFGGEHSRGSWKQWSVRQSMALLVAACIVPSAVLSAYFVVSGYQTRKSHALLDAIAVARSAGAGIDRDLSSVESGLRVLAASSALESDDLDLFYKQAMAALPSQNVTNYVLIDPLGHQRINTLRPFGTSLPTEGGPRQLQRIFETGSPVITDLFIGPVAHQPIFAIGVPVYRDGKIVYSLNAGIFPERVAATLKAQRLPTNWIVGVLDSKGTLVARSHDMQRFVGHAAVPALVQAAQREPEGIIETVTLEGVPVYTAFSRSSVSDWTFAIGIPRADLTAGLTTQLTWLLLLDASLAALALWIAWRLALTKVVRPADCLLERIHHLTDNSPESPAAPVPEGASAEFLALDDGFSQMCSRLRQRDSEREALHQAQTARTVAEAANRAKTEFLSRVSHELRTPLNAVLGFAQLLRLQKGQQLSPEQLEMIGHIESSGRHLLDMINDVLDISRIESGTLRVSSTYVDAIALARDCIDTMTEQARQAGIQLQFVQRSPTASMLGDRTRIKQIVLNLLSNGIKYNRPDGYVSLTVETDGGETWLRIRDSGLGIPPELHEHLFEPFNRLGRERTSTPGTGIGLVICKHLVSAMGGNLTVQSDGNGSEFAFYLPAPARPDPGSNQRQVHTVRGFFLQFMTAIIFLGILHSWLRNPARKS